MRSKSGSGTYLEFGVLGESKPLLVTWVRSPNELAFVLALAAVRLATTGPGTFFALRWSTALKWLRGVWQIEYLERLCPQNLHLRSLLNTTTLEP